MVSIFSLWLPILLSAIAVFIVSSILYMVLPFHRKDFKKLADEDKVMDALRPFNIPPGDYFVPCAQSGKEMKSKEYKEKMNKGPVFIMTVLPTGQQSTATNMILWFLYSILIGIFAAYITSRAVGPGAEYLQVFRFAGCSSFMAYSLALLQNSIWYKKSWCTTIKSVIDGLIYALVTAGFFGWLWPAA